MARLLGKHTFGRGHEVSVISDDDGAVKIIGAGMNIAIHADRITGVPSGWLPKPPPPRRTIKTDEDK